MRRKTVNRRGYMQIPMAYACPGDKLLADENYPPDTVSKVVDLGRHTEITLRRLHPSGGPTWLLDVGKPNDLVWLQEDR